MEDPIWVVNEANEVQAYAKPWIILGPFKKLEALSIYSPRIGLVGRPSMVIGSLDMASLY